jgi:RNA 2',3'-cyclic 3'-phosphodiesterase
VRLFVALDLPADVRSGLARWAREEVGDNDGLRLVREESLHATLVFVGERDDPSPVAAALASALEAPVPAPPLHLDGVLWLAPRRPHVLTVALADPTGGLARIQAAVSEALVRDAGLDAEARRFTPHVTVARVRGRIRPFELVGPPASDFRPVSVTLYRSRLGKDPAIYEPMASVPLSTLL